MRRDLDAGLIVDHDALDALEDRLVAARADMELVETRWAVQRDLAERLLEQRKQCAAARLGNDEGASDEPRPSLEQLEAELRALQAELAAAQASERLVSFEVCPRLVAEVISHWTGVPLSQLAREHNSKVLSFADDLRRRVRGQEQAVAALDRAIRATAAGLNRPDAPVGVFLLVGPSGVGKTETALALADLLYGGERFLTTINMSEFQEKHTVSRLIGAPPGYVGYGEGGMLTEAVRQKPYSVVLLDEVEKADPDVLNVFYQIFDKGVANDGEGREINFRNTLILMTSNLASDEIARLCAAGQRPAAEDLETAIRPALSRHFKPALLGRMKVVPYYPVAGKVLAELVGVKLARFGERLARRNLRFSHCEALVDHLAERCTHSESGARLIDHLIDQTLQPQVVDRLLAAMANGEACSRCMPHSTVMERLSVSSLKVSAVIPDAAMPGAASRLLAQLAELAWSTDTSAWLGGLMEVAAQLAGCPLAQLYLLDATHTRLTLSAEWFDGERRHDAASLPSDYDGEQLLQYCLSQNRLLSIASLDASLHATGFLPEAARPWRSCCACRCRMPRATRSGCWWSQAEPGRTSPKPSSRWPASVALPLARCNCSTACAARHTRRRPSKPILRAAPAAMA